MAGATTGSVANLLQRKYLPGIVKQFNDDFPLLRFIRQNSSAITAEGDEAHIAMELGVNEGGGFHGESADVAESGYPAIEITRVSLKQMTFRARITYKLMRKARTNANAFARGTQKQMTATKDGFTLRANMYLWGDGSGVVCRVESANLAGDELTLDRAYGLTEGGAPDGLIRRGQRLHILDTIGYTDGVTVDRGYGTVAAADYENAEDGEIVVTLRAGYTLAAVAAGDYVYIENTIEGWFDPDETEDNRPAMGMLGFYDDALRNPLQGVDTATIPEFKPTKVAAGIASTAVSTLRRARNLVAKRQRNGRVRWLISTYESHQRYSDQLDTIVEFRNVQRLDGFWEVGVFDGRPWFRDHTAPDGRVFFVPDGHTIQRFAADDFINFVDEGGNLVPNKTVFDHLLTAVYEYGISRRNNLVSVTNWTF